VDLASVAAWEPALAENGAVLIEGRRRWVRAHADAFTQRCAAIGESASATLNYNGITAEDAEDAEGGKLRGVLAAQLERQREQDLRRGLTQSGPHRDDLELRLDGHDLRVVGSAGQQRTAAIVLRMLEATTHAEATGIIPLLLLDDPFAELDRRRTQRILALLEEHGVGQCVLGVPREDEIPEQFTRLERWRVQEGVFTR
jgi:DNA replication and repair protein RecF